MNNYKQLLTISDWKDLEVWYRKSYEKHLLGSLFISKQSIQSKSQTDGIISHPKI